MQFIVTEAQLEGAEGGADQDRQGCSSGRVAQWRETVESAPPEKLFPSLLAEGVFCRGFQFTEVKTKG